MEVTLPGELATTLQDASAEPLDLDMDGTFESRLEH